MTSQSDDLSSVVVRFRRQLEQWELHRWPTLFFATVSCSMYFWNDEPLEISKGAFGLLAGIAVILYTVICWRGSSRLRLLLSLQDRLDKHLDNHIGDENAGA